MENNIAIQTQNQDTELTAPQDGSVEFLIAKAIDKDTPVETMEKLLAMRREYRAEKAKEAFDDAMAKFQAACPTIKKEKPVKDRNGKLLYAYAPLESIVEQVKDKITEHGFSYLIKTEVLDNGVKGVKVTCIVKHKFGHSEESTMEVPLGQGTQIMSAPQVTASATTFAKRYAFNNAFGIMTGDEDNDAQTAVKPEPTYHPDPQTPEKKHYCQRHYAQLKEKVEITEKVASYSKSKYGFELCLACQKAAQEAHRGKTVPKYHPSPKTPEKPKSATRIAMERGLNNFTSNKSNMRQDEASDTPQEAPVEPENGAGS